MKKQIISRKTRSFNSFKNTELIRSLKTNQPRYRFGWDKLNQTLIQGDWNPSKPTKRLIDLIRVAREKQIFIVTSCTAPPRPRSFEDVIDYLPPTVNPEVDMCLQLNINQTDLSLGNCHRKLDVMFTKVREPSFEKERFQLTFPLSGLIPDSKKMLQQKQKVLSR